MPQFRTTRQVRHAAADMFALVADVERYPEFVPLCQALKVRRRMQSGEGVEVLTASMTVAYKMLSETFSSRVTLDRPRFTIMVEYLDGPFSHLDNRWRFQTLGPNQSEVDFFISYAFRSRTLGFVMGAVFDAAFRRFSEAFEQRADAIYGTASISAAGNSPSA